MTAKLIICGILCLASVITGACSRRDRREAVGVGLVLLAVWVIYVWPWVHAPSSPLFVLYRLGIHGVKHEHIWMLTDALASMAVLLIGFQRPWVWGVWGCFIAMLCCHAVETNIPLPFDGYTRSLDAAFLGQLAILFWLGGPGVCDRLSRGVRYLRRNLLPRLASYLEG